jgi:hypothetical protein
MIKEVSVYNFVDDHYDDHDQQPNPPVGNKMLPHTGSIGFANRFVKLSKEEDSRLRECSGTMLLICGGAGGQAFGMCAPFCLGSVLVCAGAQPYLGARIVSGDEMIDGVLSPRGFCGRSVYGGRPARSGLAAGALRELAAKASV